MKNLMYSLIFVSVMTAFVAIWISANQLAILNLEKWKVILHTSIICCMLPVLLANVILFFKIRRRIY